METQEKIVKINLLVSDRVVHNLSESIIEIAAAMHKDRDIIIALNTEGPSIEQLTYRVRDNLLHLLESLCEKMPYDPDRIQIETGNLIEECKGKFALRKGNTIKGWFYGKHLAKIELQSVKKFEYHYQMKNNLGRSHVQTDNDRVRVTLWSFEKGEETGFHVHEYDYVVVPMLTGSLRIVDKDGNSTISELSEGISYYRKKGVAHNVINNNDFPFKFVEIEIK